MNMLAFYNISTESYGSINYDHIVPVFQIDSKYDDDLYHADDVIFISDNGESACIGAKDAHVCDDITPQYIYSYVFGEFIGTRSDANTKTGVLYTLPVRSFGIVHTGIVDLNSETFPVSITTDKDHENPQITQGSET